MKFNVRINPFVPCIVLFMCSLPLQAAKRFDISDVVQPYIDRRDLAGVVTLVATKDQVLSLEAFGYADIAKKIPMRTDALFWIASMSKPIAATALMLLVDEGKVRLDDPIEKYLPQFAPSIVAATTDGTQVRLQRPQHAITARSLLSHTSGLLPQSSIEAPTLDQYTLSVLVQSYALMPLMSEPGDRFSYSNAGIGTAARVVEVVSGMPYSEFLQRRLFDPLGMEDTTFWPSESQLERLAKSYRADAEGNSLEEVPIAQLRYPLTDRHQRHAFPGGGLFSSASDLAKFCQMLLNGGTLAGRRYVSEALIHEMTRNQLSRQTQSDFKPPQGYGLGWFTSDSGAFGHFGALSTNMRIVPKEGLATVWLVQYSGNGEVIRKSLSAFEQAVSKRFKSDATPH